MIKYIGSKRKLVPWISSVIDEISAASSVRSVADLFAGTCRVSCALKERGYAVHANEFFQPILDELNALPGEDGWIVRAFCQEARYFREENGRRVQAIRQRIDEVSGHDATLKAILLTSLMLAADRVDSTTGVQMAFLKEYAERASCELVLKVPPLLPGRGRATGADALEIAPEIKADLVYLDPPYNQHSYLSNYHVWESLVLNDDPDLYGIARKRVDCKTRKSPFNFKSNALEALSTLVSRLDAPHLVVSFNNEGYCTSEAIENLLGRERHVIRLARPHRRYVGALIGIHDRTGKKVGKVSHLTNREFLFVASRELSVIERLREVYAAEGEMAAQP
jgi:adenine-specific DNA-methyltransferase